MQLRRKDTQTVEMQMGPMIDMVFLLLVFFMVSAKPIKQESDVNIGLPGTVAQEEVLDIPDDALVVPNDMLGRRIARVRDGISGGWQRFDGTWKEALLAGWIDTETIAYRLLDESPMKSELGVAFAKGTHAELSAALTQTLEQMQYEGTTGRILEKYGVDAQKAMGGDENA